MLFAPNASGSNSFARGPLFLRGHHHEGSVQVPVAAAVLSGGEIVLRHHQGFSAKLMQRFEKRGGNPARGCEGIVIGRLLAGYGEIEMAMCACLVAVEGMLDIPIRRLFDTRGAENRIKAAKKALQIDFANAGLLADLTQALADMDWCRVGINIPIANGFGQHKRDCAL